MAVLARKRLHQPPVDGLGPKDGLFCARILDVIVKISILTVDFPPSASAPALGGFSVLVILQEERVIADIFFQNRGVV